MEIRALLLMDPCLFWGFSLTSHCLSSYLPVRLDLPKPLWSMSAAPLIPGAEDDLHDGEMLPCIQCYIFLIVIIVPAFCKEGFLSQLFETAGLPPCK